MAMIARHLHPLYRVLRYDRRGYGRSWPHQGPFDIADQVNDLVELLQGRTAVLFGHSFGGNVALATAQRIGAQVRGVGTYETPLSWLPGWSGSTGKRINTEDGVEIAAERFMIRLIGQQAWLALPERTKQTRRREGLALTQELALLRKQAPWDPNKIICPMISSHGSRGASHHVEAAQWLASNIVNASVETIEGAKHSAPITHSLQLVSQVILPLLSGRTAITLVSEP